MPIKLRHKIDFFKGEGLGIITQKKDSHLKFSAKKKKCCKKKQFFRTSLCSPHPQKSSMYLNKTHITGYSEHAFNKFTN